MIDNVADKVKEYVPTGTGQQKFFGCMLSRRYLRIKAMQALYAFFQNEGEAVVDGEKQMFDAIEKIYELYLSMLSLLVHMQFVAECVIEEGKSKLRPSEQELKPNTKFTSNKLLKQLGGNSHLLNLCLSGSISWEDDLELVRRVYNDTRKSEAYTLYMSTPVNGYGSEREGLINIYKDNIDGNPVLETFFEEKSIYWVDDYDFVNNMVIKTLGMMEEKYSPDDILIFPLYKNEEEDKEFAANLFRKTIEHSEETGKYIANKTRNWEIDRIAMMDVLLMKMAITEILYFPTIPVKVTLNEYIEISKYYSTPKSRIFINGILDKLVVDFRAEGKIQKEGRGLIE